MKKNQYAVLPLTLSAFILVLAALYIIVTRWGVFFPSPSSQDVNIVVSDVPRNMAAAAENSITSEEAMIHYVLPYGRLRMEAQEWTDPEQLDPDKLVRFGCDSMTGDFLGSYQEFASHHRAIYPQTPLPDSYKVGGNLYAIPREELENSVAKYLDVSTSHLRRSSLYDEEKKAYLISPEQPSPDGVPQVTASMREGDKITVVFNMLMPTGPWESDGNAGQYKSSQYLATLIMTVEDQGEGAFKYRSVGAANKMELPAD